MAPTINEQLQSQLQEATRKAEIASQQASFLDGVAFGLREALEVAPPDAVELRAALVTYLAETLPERAHHYEANPQETPTVDDALHEVGYDLRNILEAYDARSADGVVKDLSPDGVDRLFARENLRPPLAEFYAEVRGHIEACRNELGYLKSLPGDDRVRLGRVIRAASCRETFERVARRLAEILGTTYRPEDGDDDAAGE